MSVTILKILLSLLAALAIVYFVFPLRQAFFLFVLFTLMLPVPILVVPLFAFFSSLHWINTYQGLILPFIASATGVLLFRQHFLSIPTSLVDAARMDGAGPFRFLRDVLVPMSMNTIGAMAVIEFIYVWNQYLWPLLATTSQDMGVVQLGIHMLAGTGSQSDWGLIMAGVVIAALPPLAVFLMLQEQFMRGFALSRSK